MKAKQHDGFGFNGFLSNISLDFFRYGHKNGFDFDHLFFITLKELFNITYTVSILFGKLNQACEEIFNDA